MKEKGKFASNDLVSNPEPLFPDIPLIPLHYQVDPPNLPKPDLIILNVTFLNINNRVAPNIK